MTYDCCTECFTYPACHETGNIYPDEICPYYQEKEAGEKQIQEELKKLKLKSCPFCGGKAHLEKMGSPHHVFCTVCGAKTTGVGFEKEGEKSAIEKWNRRVENDVS